MRIGELSRRTGVHTRMLRYYEEQGLLRPARVASGYRSYGDAAVPCVRQIRGRLDSGLTTEIIRGILPFLSDPGEIPLHPECLTQETAALLRGEIDRIQSRIDCLARNRDALRAYLDTVQPGTPRP
ncbi:DNA-binding transcriptional MerR regulator [Streptomyces sp. Ag82_O1-15]|jgi:DNA-binding transcriptional MerR regulator|uniref:MerR family transcriptional regulator n=1 Tax=Streptomyces sp. Ag82_O1-15 TaxID=1938855 RepID=UPI000BB13E68|nr:MerR family transcriptional regulator [Streptomyces sp. Ag82_O1-15]PBD01373.1 DNA-binding transcriptional MerR regulator [Streptomyces sp. Ag82_O1-15]